MAIRSIINDTNDRTKDKMYILHEKSEKIVKFDENLADLVNDLKETLEACGSSAVGLAAPQVGVLQRVIAISFGGKVRTFINPEIVEKSGEVVSTEGCLSFSNVYLKIKRPSKVKVKYVDISNTEQEEVHDYPESVIFCHEIDHLDGKVITDKLFK